MLSKLSLEDKSYVVGLLQGDGCLSKSSRNRGKLSYEISIRDRDIIDKLYNLFIPFVHVNVSERVRSTNFKSNYHSISLTICNLQFRNELNEYMPYGKKDNTIKPHNSLIKKDYIRGLIDADGSIGLSKDRCFIGLCISSDNIKDFFLESILKITGRRKVLHRNKRDNVYNIILFDEDAQIYSDYLYDSSGLCINRKYDKFLEIMKWKRDPKKKKKYMKIWIDSENDIVVNPNFSIEEKMRILDRTEQSVKTRIWKLKGTIK